MRVWDCDPALLARKHLLKEWAEIGQVWRAVHFRRHGVFNDDGRTGTRVGFIDHPETLRFVPVPWMLVCRYDALWAEFHARGYDPQMELEAIVRGLSVNTVTLVDVIERGDDHRLVRFSEADGTWDGFIDRFEWPLLGDEPATPWDRDGVTYDHYRTLGPYADLDAAA